MSDGKAPRGRPPERITVIVYFPRRASAFGDPDLDTKAGVEIAWPKLWPLPQAGSRIQIGERFGFVEYINFSPLDSKMSIHTR